MNKQLFCFDIDGTLVDNETHSISSSTLEALRTLKEKGHVLFIATGRGKDSLLKTEIIHAIKWDAYICSNGIMILDQDFNTVKSYTMNKESIREVIDVASKENSPVMIKSNPRFINKEPNAYTLNALKFFNNKLPVIKVYEGEDVYGLIVYGPIGYDYKPYKDIEGILVMPGESTYCDIGIKGISKGTSILEYAKTFNIDEYICFGDSQNDIDMFKLSAYSVAMGQGNQLLKDQANLVTSSIDDDGIYNALVYMNYI